MVHFSVTRAVRPMDKKDKESYMAGVDVGVTMCEAAILSRLKKLIQTSREGGASEDVLEAMIICLHQSSFMFSRLRDMSK